MGEILELVMTHLRSIWRFRWYIHLIAWPVCFAGWVTVHKMPDEYVSTAKVFVDTDSVLKPLLQGLAVGTDIRQQVKIMTRSLMSHPNLLKIIQMTDMNLDINTPEEEELLIKKLQKKINIQGSSRDNLYTLKYTDNDPQMARNVVQALLTIFVENTLGDTRKDTDSAQRFINEQIKEYETRLLAAEMKLKEFKRRNVGFMPSEGKDYYQRLQEAMRELTRAELLLREETFRRDELRRQQLGEEPSFGIMATSPTSQDVPLVTTVDARIAELQARLDELLLKYTDNHPDVAAIIRKISQLKKQQKQEVEKRRKAMDTFASEKMVADINANPVYQRLKVSLSEAESNVAALQVRVNEYQSRVESLKAKVNIIPQVEAELAQLNRDYEINKRNYETLITRRESAKISEQAEKNSDNIKFNVIDPPRVPLHPVAPNRMLLSTAVFIGGLGVGVVFAFFLSQIRPTFNDRRSIMSSLEGAYLGAVSIVRTKRQRLVRKLEMASFGLVFIGLVALYASYLTYQIVSSSGSAG